MNNDVTEQETADLIDQNFELYFKENISPEIDVFKAELDRKAAAKKEKLAIAIGATAIAFLLLALSGLWNYIGLVPIVYPILASVLGLHKEEKKEAAINLRDVVYDKAFIPSFRFYFPEIEFRSRRSLSPKILNSILLPELVGVSTGGFYKINVRNQLVQCFQYFGKDKFGSLFVLRGPANFDHKAVVIHKKSSSMIHQLLNHSFFSNENKVELESPDFDKRFLVYANNQVEVRYLLTTSYMERLYNFSEAIGEHVSFSVTDQRLFIKIPNVQYNLPPYYENQDVLLADILRRVRSFRHLIQWLEYLDVSSD